MQSPEDVRQQLATRYQRQHRRWFVEHSEPQRQLGAWPLDLALGRPTEQDFIAAPARVRDWVVAWERHAPLPPGVRIDWAERQWPRLGRQRLPERLVVESADAVAAVLGAGSDWRRACERAGRLAAHWPGVAGHPVLGRLFDALAGYAGDDFDRLLALLVWADANRASGLYLRQLPIEGLDTKWISSRSAVATELLRFLRMSHGDAADATDLHSLLGLKRPPARIRMRLLCPELRRQVGGLEDLEVPVEQLAGLELQPRTVLIVENLETGLALPDIPGVAAIMKLGAAVRLLARVQWLARARCLYWGDIDTFGFEILSRGRGVLPHLESVMMDAPTLTNYLALCVTEQVQVAVPDLALLTDTEREVFVGLRTGRWGPRLRLEQERIPWAAALLRLTAAVG